jgi:hypothetical protein
MQRFATARLCIAILVVLFTVAACGIGADDAPIIEPEASAERSPEITDITEDLFGNAHYVGQTVTVTGKVTRIITPTSFILTGDEYDDDSILVLSAGKYDPELYRQLTVTGEVQRFNYPDYRGYELDDDDAYGEFIGKEFIVAGPPRGTESAKPSPAGT